MRLPSGGRKPADKSAVGTRAGKKAGFHMRRQGKKKPVRLNPLEELLSRLAIVDYDEGCSDAAARWLGSRTNTNNGASP